jgi:hypothetical protein
MKIILVFGCWGREDEGFCSCSGVKNQILNLSKQSGRNKAIIDYLDSNFRMCDKPLYNNVHTALWNIQDKFSTKGKPVFKETIFKRMEEFCSTHIKCGLFLRLELAE